MDLTDCTDSNGVIQTLAARCRQVMAVICNCSSSTSTTAKVRSKRETARNNVMSERFK